MKSMNKKRKPRSSKFKARVALEAIKGEKTAAELISEYAVTSGQISTWKKQLLEGLPDVFDNRSQPQLDAEALTRISHKGEFT
jgi:transposase-like protein